LSKNYRVHHASRAIYYAGLALSSGLEDIF
jgi:hypothetical protein